MAKSNALKAACLAASLATAWTAVEAKGDELQLNVSASLSQPVSDVMLMVGDQGVSVPNSSTGVSAIATPGGWQGTISLSSLTYLSGVAQPWVMIGLGTGAMSSDVFVVSPAGTLNLNVPFEQAFPGADEKTLGGRISRDDSVDVDAFLLSQESSVLTLGFAGTLMIFSNGVNIGTATVTATPLPEPGSLGLLAMAVGGLLKRFGRGKRGR
jgi:hypothetical protein